MNRNSAAIAVFCSYLSNAEDIAPLEPREWSDMADRLRELGLEPGQLLDFERQDFISRLDLPEKQADRYVRLLDRSGSLSFEINKYENMGIHIVTRADSDYPKKLKKKLGNACPPLFYCAGDLDLLDKDAIGYVGSRHVDEDDINFTRKAVAITSGRGFTVVSGGAKGIDSISADAAMAEGVPVIEYLSDSMLRKMRDSALVREIQDGRVLLVSVVVPTAGFNVGVAMMRNKYIYAQSEGTVVVRSDKEKGGTWAGAVENLKHKWCTTLCRDCEYPGNKELIRLGAVPIKDDWDGSIKVPVEEDLKAKEEKQPVQISMFDM